MRTVLFCGVSASVLGISCAAILVALDVPVLLVSSMAAAASATLAVFLQDRRCNLELKNRLQLEQDEHQATRDFIQRILDVIPMPVYVKDADSRYLIVNQAQSEQWGRPISELIGLCSLDLARDEAFAQHIRAEDAAVLGGQRIYKEEHKQHAATGEEQYRVVTKGSCTGLDGRRVIVCALFDTTSWRQTENAQKEALERETLLRERTQDFVQRLIDVIPDPFYVKDARTNYVLVNEALSRETARPREALVGVRMLDYCPPDKVDITISEDSAVLEHGISIEKEEHLIHPETGQERFRNVIKRRCTYLDGSQVIVVAHMNITRWKIAERELERLANEDSLTSLATRRRFTEEAIRLSSRAERHDEPLSLILLDLDHFKQINDGFGHQAGDEVLRRVASIVLSQLRNEDVPCRWGGEEFALLLPMTTVDRALVLANRLREQVASTSFDTRQTIHVTISCGITEWRQDDSLERMMARADRALYEAKGAGRNTCVIAAATETGL